MRNIEKKKPPSSSLSTPFPPLSPVSISPLLLPLLHGSINYALLSKSQPSLRRKNHSGFQVYPQGFKSVASVIIYRRYCVLGIDSLRRSPYRACSYTGHLRAFNQEYLGKIGGLIFTRPDFNRTLSRFLRFLRFLDPLRYNYRHLVVFRENVPSRASCPARERSFAVPAALNSDNEISDLITLRKRSLFTIK